jgi:hypothetical protein
MSKKGDDEATFILPGGGTANRGTQSLPTDILPGGGRTGSPSTGVAGVYTDPFETVLMPTARRAGSPPTSEMRPMNHTPSAAPMSDTVVLRPDQHAGTQAPAGKINPTVAVLIVTGGPGKGSCCQLYYGNNSIGRDAGQTVRLDFGDQSISSQEQAFIRYDFEDRKFLFIPNLSKTNVVAVNADKPTAAVELKAWDEIRIGQTRLRFVPVCGPQFDWGDVVDQ